MGSSKRWSAADFAALLWVALHFSTGVQAFLHGLYRTYTGWTWVLLAVWLLGLLALDVRLYAAGRPGLLRFVKWYWAFSAALTTGVMLAADLDLIRDVNGILVFGVLCSFLTPLNQLLAFTWLLFKWMAGLPGMGRYGTGCGAVLLFCLIHFIYFAWLHRRAMKNGAPHGPVDLARETEE